jgi:hypothetical protein
MTLDQLAAYFVQSVLCFAGFAGFALGLVFSYKVTYEK